MKRKSILKPFMLSILPLLFLASCYSAPEGGSRGSLSDAMDRAEDDWEGSREVPDDDDTWQKRDDQEDNNQEDNYEVSTVEPLDLDLVYMIRGGAGLISGPYFKSPVDGELLLGVDEENWALYGTAGFKYTETSPAHDIYDSVNTVVGFIYAGGEFRYYPFEKWKFFSPYGLARMTVFIMFWDYINDITASDGEVIGGDSVDGMEFSLGAGVELLRTEHVFLGVTIIPQALLFGMYTQEEFTNDYFVTPYGEIRCSIELGFR